MPDQVRHDAFAYLIAGSIKASAGARCPSGSFGAALQKQLFLRFAPFKKGKPDIIRIVNN
jgi:hypothetical protein